MINRNLGIWPMEDHLWWQNGEQEEFLHGYGHYYENYRKVGGHWLICYRKLTRLNVDTTVKLLIVYSAC